jgi:hypothetical protein
MRCDERSKSVMSLHKTLRQTSNYISSVSPASQGPASKLRHKTRMQKATNGLGCRHSATRRWGHDVGIRSWGLQTCQLEAQSPIASGSAYRMVIIPPFKRRCFHCVETFALQNTLRRVKGLHGQEME